MRNFTSFAVLLLGWSWPVSGFLQTVNLFDDTDPSIHNLRLIKDLRHIKNVKKGLEGVFQASEVVTEQRISVIGKHLESYVEYWLQFYRVRINFKPNQIEMQPSYYLACICVALLMHSDATDIVIV